jgi:hypothetical protein
LNQPLEAERANGWFFLGIAVSGVNALIATAIIVALM